ncbi:IS110 family transposase [Cohnella sp. WQ 127256]|uniref:IS110 family transposase n=1 Tax=Cohnella sp. WQ 127256 TaxID=2938790 RepID=UPI0021180D8B|nr:IS110 family transposase [Cohnella sp. WQ 127256]
MQNPVLSIDVAKGKSVAAAFSAYDSIVRKPFSFPHTPQGVSALLPLLEQLEVMTEQRPHVVLEATGNYSKPLVSYFSSMGYPVVILNPLLTHQLKKKATRKVKTDPIDALRIAQAFYLERVSPVQMPDSAVSELRVLCRQHFQLTSLYGDVQLHFRSVLDLLFPGYERTFQNICNPTSLELLSHYSTPQDFLAADQDHLLSILLNNRRGRSWNEVKLAQLNIIARESLPDPEVTLAHQIALRNYISLIRSYQGALADVDHHLQRLASSLPEHTLLRSIPGVGPLTAATIYAEIGDIKRFPSVKQLTAFAGLDSSVYESGTFKANQNHISKRGSAYLRTALYQATVAGISKQVNGPRNEILSKYYQLKRSQGKPVKVAIVATANKLLRIVFGVLNSRTPFYKD